MITAELLSALLALFGGHLSGVDFLPAWDAQPGSRHLDRPLVTGEVDSEVVKPASKEVRLRFRIYLPAGQTARTGQEIFAEMCRLAGEHYPGFSAIARGGADRDKTTGHLVIPCTLTFLTDRESGGSAPGEGLKVTLGGREYTADSAKVTMEFSGKELTSVWEADPFAVLDPAVRYVVELNGIAPEGLEKMAGFTAVIGEEPGTIYKNCRWKSMSTALKKAVFTAGVKE